MNLNCLIDLLDPEQFNEKYYSHENLKKTSQENESVAVDLVSLDKGMQFAQ